MKRFNFALIGAGGYIAPRHMEAIKGTGNNLTAALDLGDSVGILDRYFPDAHFFTEPERFERHIEKLRRKNDGTAIDFVSVCSPNYLHDAHIRLALRSKANAICEKPLVINPWNLDQLTEIEEETGKIIYNVLQLRLHPSIVNLKAKFENYKGPKKEIYLDYITSRGRWYYQSWKGREEQSGGILTNIGIHFFDMLMWVFGDLQDFKVIQLNESTGIGEINLANANIHWKLSIDRNELPEGLFEKGKTTFRSLRIEEEEVEFSDGFTELHTLVYKDILYGGGFRISDARPSIELVYQLRNYLKK